MQETIWKSDSVLMKYKLDNFRTKFNLIKQEEEWNDGMMLNIFGKPIFATIRKDLCSLFPNIQFCYLFYCVVEKLMESKLSAEDEQAKKRVKRSRKDRPGLWRILHAQIYKSVLPIAYCVRLGRA